MTRAGVGWVVARVDRLGGSWIACRADSPLAQMAAIKTPCATMQHAIDEARRLNSRRSR